MEPAERIHELTRLLTADSRLWTERPFTGLPLAWETDHPGLARALRGLSEQAADANQRDPLAWAGAPADFAAWAERARDLCAWPDLSVRPHPTGPPPRQVPQRKWDQIVAFGQVVAHRRPVGVDHWLEWCAGKAHLGRWLGRASGLPLRAVELRGRLCDEGARLASQDGVQADFTQADVLVDEQPDRLGPTTAAVALHACGELHVRLLRRVVERGCGFVAVAPCCYHRFGPRRFAPLSAAGRAAGLALEPHQLRLVGFDEVVASPRRRARRQQEETWRLAFDLLQREITGQDSYRPVGQVPTEWLDETFETFARRIAQREAIDLPAGMDLAAWEARGAERRRLVRALGTARALFRRPLESWLFSDRVAYLAENGFEVAAGTFCHRRVTPRNLLLVATA